MPPVAGEVRGGGGLQVLDAHGVVRGEVDVLRRPGVRTGVGAVRGVGDGDDALGLRDAQGEAVAGHEVVGGLRCVDQGQHLSLRPRAVVLDGGRVDVPSKPTPTNGHSGARRGIRSARRCEVAGAVHQVAIHVEPRVGPIVGRRHVVPHAVVNADGREGLRVVPGHAVVAVSFVGNGDPEILPGAPDGLEGEGLVGRGAGARGHDGVVRLQGGLHPGCDGPRVVPQDAGGSSHGARRVGYKERLVGGR
mmetsp:Transcript_62975/g.144922  ORF Transcript_62975/g.144922 Transcript_62975/m.144922 type:complete len:248 (-) Transcript_62975:1501-2244(-)